MTAPKVCRRGGIKASPKNPIPLTNIVYTVVLRFDTRTQGAKLAIELFMNGLKLVHRRSPLRRALNMVLELYQLPLYAAE